MRKILLALSLIVCSFTSLDAVPIASTVIDQSTGDGVSVWETWDSSGNTVIRASVLSGGTWGTAVTISDPLKNAHKPTAATNTNGAIAVIWQVDIPSPPPGSPQWELGGAMYDVPNLVWFAPATLSANYESVDFIEDYFVRLSTSNAVVVTYLAKDWSNFGITTLRGIFSSYGTWSSPVNIDP